MIKVHDGSINRGALEGGDDDWVPVFIAGPQRRGCYAVRLRLRLARPRQRVALPGETLTLSARYVRVAGGA